MTDKETAPNITIYTENDSRLLPETPYEIVDNRYTCCNALQGMWHGEHCPNRLMNRIKKADV